MRIFKNKEWPEDVNLIPVINGIINAKTKEFTEYPPRKQNIHLISEPFWLYSSWNSRQWGIFALSLWYAFSFINGIYNHWWKHNPTLEDRVAELENKMNQVFPW